MSESLARLCRDPFTAQVLALIAEKPGINTTQLAERLNQTRSHSALRRQLAQLRQAGLLTARIPEKSNQSYGWTLAGYQAPLVESGFGNRDSGIATPPPEPRTPPPEPRPLRHSAQLPTGLTEEDMAWHRYWHSRAVQRNHRLAELEDT